MSREAIVHMLEACSCAANTRRCSDFSIRLWKWPLVDACDLSSYLHSVLRWLVSAFMLVVQVIVARKLRSVASSFGSRTIVTPRPRRRVASDTEAVE